jgi:hypothetical protein
MTPEVDQRAMARPPARRRALKVVGADRGARSAPRGSTPEHLFGGIDGPDPLLTHAFACTLPPLNGRFIIVRVATQAVIAAFRDYLRGNAQLAVANGPRGLTRNRAGAVPFIAPSFA